jgi:HEAT repeats
MEREQLESQIIDYIDGKLNDDQRAALEQRLANDPEAFALYEQFRDVIGVMNRAAQYEPTSRVRRQFEAALDEELRKQRGSRQIFLTPVFYRAAAAVALVAAGIAGGLWIASNQRQEEEMLALRKEVEATKQLMQSMLENQSSASQRLQGVSVSFKLPNVDDDVVKVLVRTLNEDPNSNVRLAAMDALARFEADAIVRQALVSSLSTQKDPVVQIALIQLLVRLNEKRVIKDLERIVEDEQNLEAVKDEAYSGILKLS